MSFTNTPVTRLSILGIVGVSVAASLLDVKHGFYILIDTHIWRYRQLWRFLIYQTCYTNSTEVLFAAISLYNLRIVERMWGSRKYASFLIVSYLLSSLLNASVMTILSLPFPGLFNYMPAGPTPLFFASLAQYCAIVPHMYKYRIATSEAPPTDDAFTGLTLSDKTYRYVLAVHLAILQWPGSVVAAASGWIVGQAWRLGLLPVSLLDWRLPGRLFGLRTIKGGAGFEGLRRRLEDENPASATATGTDGQSDGRVNGQAERRRTMGQQIVDQFRQAL